VAAVVAGEAIAVRAVSDAFVDHGVRVDVVDDGGVYAGDGAVVVEIVAAPVGTEVACADVSEAVVDAAVEAYVVCPVAAVEEEVGAGVAPVGGRPESAVVGCEYPLAGNPEEAVSVVGPVAGAPEVECAGREGLVVVDEWRGRLVGLVVGSVAGGDVVGGGLRRSVGLGLWLAWLLVGGGLVGGGDVDWSKVNEGGIGAGVGVAGRWWRGVAGLRGGRSDGEDGEEA